MKSYPKVNEDICRIEKWPKRKVFLGTVAGTLDEFTPKIKAFYHKAHLEIFDQVVRQIWIEQNLTLYGKRIVTRTFRGINGGIILSNYFKLDVGISHRVLTTTSVFGPVATYLVDFFPEFLFHDPFEHPELYKYPYKHVTLDHLYFVCQVENRLELLAEAEKRAMSYGEFTNWAVNWVKCYNDEKGEDIYVLAPGYEKWPKILNRKLRMGWYNDKFNFNTR